MPSRFSSFAVIVAERDSFVIMRTLIDEAVWWTTIYASMFVEPPSPFQFERMVPRHVPAPVTLQLPQPAARI
ncbi:MAG: hypothetical protein U0271_45845 [Polyangiaceae bacterium]